VKKLILFGCILTLFIAACESDRVFGPFGKGAPQPNPGGGFRGTIFDLSHSRSSFKLDMRTDTLKVEVEKNTVITMAGDTTALSKKALKNGQDVTVTGTLTGSSQDKLEAKSILIH
jgi:hypothetical protein